MVLIRELIELEHTFWAKVESFLHARKLAAFIRVDFRRGDQETEVLPRCRTRLLYDRKFYAYPLVLLDEMSFIYIVSD